MPNANGWYNADVTVHFTAGDDLSGVETVTPDVTIATKGANQSVTGTAAEKAGNTASVTLGNINIDKTLPEITINVLTSTSGSVPSGEAINTASAGAKIFTVNAGDNAGNSDAKSITYYVRYTCSGVMKPINQDGSSVFKGNVPVKLRLADANALSAMPPPGSTWPGSPAESPGRKWRRSPPAMPTSAIIAYSLPLIIPC